MEECINLSSDSNDTIIYSPLSPEVIPCTNTIQGVSIETNDIEAPFIKRLRLQKNNSDKLVTSSSCNSSSSQEDNYLEDDNILERLQRKYQSIEPTTSEISKKTTIPRVNKENEKVEKIFKRLLKTTNKNLQPSECKKFIEVHLDYDFKNEVYISEMLTALQAAEIDYKFESQIISKTVTWTRKVEEHFMNDEKLDTKTEKKGTDEVLLIMNTKDFINYISNKSLCGYINSVKSLLFDKKLSLVIYDLKSYKRYLKRERKASISDQLLKTDGSFTGLPKVTASMIEYGLTEIQILCSCSHRFLDTPSELGLFVAQYSKAIAQIPFKQQKQEKLKHTQWFVSGDNRDTVKVDKNGIARLETAEAICLQYPTISSLMQAYENLPQKEGESLLQDIPVRRAAGPLSASRKIGVELSKKIYNFLTSIDGDNIL